MNKCLFPLLAFFIISASFTPGAAKAEDGYRLWLRYDLIGNPRILQSYRNSITSLQLAAATTTAAKDTTMKHHQKKGQGIHMLTPLVLDL